MKYAITPRGIGRRVGARLIHDDWPLEEGELFVVAEEVDIPNMVLSADGNSLETGTPPPMTAEERRNILEQVINESEPLKILLLSLENRMNISPGQLIREAKELIK